MKIFEFDQALVRRPGRSVVDGLRAGDHESPTFDRIFSEHQTYVAALEAAGVQVSILPALEEFPDSIFVEDPALVFGEGAILLRAGAPSRSGEVALLEPELRTRFPHLLTLADGFADGGDVLVTPGKVYIGLSNRTDAEGARALTGLLGELGRIAEPVAMPAGILHLKSASSPVDEETILTTRALADSGIFAGMRTLLVPQGEEAAANILRVNDVVLAGADFPRTLDMLAAHGSMSFRWRPRPSRSSTPGSAACRCVGATSGRSLRKVRHRRADLRHFSHPAMRLAPSRKSSSENGRPPGRPRYARHPR